MSEKYDITVIGSGPGGYRAAILAALRGQRVAIVEKADWGGCCLNRGCVPKKAWHHSAQLLAANDELAKRGLRGRLEADLAGAWDHQEGVVATVQDSYINYMKRLGVTAVTGHARLGDAHTVCVADAHGTEQELKTEHVILATGSHPFLPAGVEPVSGRILTTDMLFDERPPEGRRVAVIGSGVIGTEFAFILHMLGCEVTWLTGSAPLSRTAFSRQALGTLKSALARHGVEARTGARLAGTEVVTGAGGEEVLVKLEDGSEVRCDWLLLGTGRVPYTEGLGLEDLGMALDERGFVARNDQLQTSVPNIYAIGDCTSEQMTANQALADATLVVENIIDGAGRAQEPAWVPEAVYSAVELARIGLDDDTAEDEGYEPAVGFAAFETSPRALGQSDTDGFVRLLGDMDSGELLGGEIVGAEAAELIHLLSTAPDRDTALKWLARGRYNHPGRAEELLNATETMASKWGLEDFLFGR